MWLAAKPLMPSPPWAAAPMAPSAVSPRPTTPRATPTLHHLRCQARGNIVNQVKWDFNGLGQLTSEWQSHSGAVTGSSPRVQNAYSEMPSGANHSRLTSVTYASGYAVNYNYASGPDSNISRLSSLSDASNTLEA
jgi:hypothetical protein